MKTEHLRKKLEKEKEKLESEMEKIGQRNPRIKNDWEAAPEEPGIEPDLMDQVDIVMNRENTAAIFADLEARFDTVIAALERIEKKTYGKCEVCGHNIEEARLEADPVATTCIAHL